jgi:hypothetical protein
MIMREREGLVARIRQIRRTSAVAEPPSAGPGAGPDGARIDALEARIARLEHLVEGFQDSVHRESARQGKLLAELQAQVQPAAMNAALSKDARERGL